MKRIVLALMAAIVACSLTVAYAFTDEAQAPQETPYFGDDTLVVYIVDERPTVPQANEEDIERIAKALWGECRGVPSKDRQAAVVWCILNRVDDPRWPDTIEGVVVPSQFNGYHPDNPVDPELYDLALDVWNRWQLEKAGETSVGRVLPREYVFFIGDSKENYFSVEYLSTLYWDWSLPNPYEKAL